MGPIWSPSPYFTNQSEPIFFSFLFPFNFDFPSKQTTFSYTEKKPNPAKKKITPSQEEPLDLHSIRSQLNQLDDIPRSYNVEIETPNSDSHQLLNVCALHLESKMKEIISEYSDVGFLGIEDLDAYMEHLKEELNTVSAESAKIANEIELLSRNQVEDYVRFESGLEELKCSLDLITSQGMEKGNEDPHVECSSNNGDNQSKLTNGNGDFKLEIMELEDEIEKKNVVLNSLQDLDFTFRRLDAIEQIEDMFTGLKVIEFDRNCIRLSLRTNVPKLEGLLSQQNIEDASKPSELYHELLIEVMDGTIELKNVEIFPNDIYIGDIVDAVKSFRELFSQSALLGTRSSLEWFVGKVQDRAILSTLKRSVLKSANKSRHSFEFLERDNTTITHLAGEVYAFIKVSQGWPLSKSLLKLMPQKSSNPRSKGISLSFLLCKVEMNSSGSGEFLDRTHETVYRDL